MSRRDLKDLDTNDRIVLDYLCESPTLEGDSQTVRITSLELAGPLGLEQYAQSTDHAVNLILTKLEDLDYILITFSDSKKITYDVTLGEKAENTERAKRE